MSFRNKFILALLVLIGIGIQCYYNNEATVLKKHQLKLEIYTKEIQQALSELARTPLDVNFNWNYHNKLDLKVLDPLVTYGQSKKVRKCASVLRIYVEQAVTFLKNNGASETDSYLHKHLCKTDPSQDWATACNCSNNTGPTGFIPLAARDDLDDTPFNASVGMTDTPASKNLRNKYSTFSCNISSWGCSSFRGCDVLGTDDQRTKNCMKARCLTLSIKDGATQLLSNFEKDLASD